MDRIIGIDYGRKRVGVAVSDPLGIFASALDTVQSAKIMDYLKKYAENENVIRFVIGYPVNMDGAQMTETEPWGYIRGRQGCRCFP